MRKVFSLILIIVLQCCNLTFAQVEDRGVRNKPVPPTEKRLALVIGNSAYQNTTALPNPQNDAADMKAALESLGFEVVYGVNQNARQMKALMRQFGDKLLQNKGVGLFYYAGHGIASGGENYLVPTDADIPAEDEIQDATVSLSFLLGKMAVADNSLNIVILDACRNNPFARKWRTMRDSSAEGGLATIRQAPTGTLIAYATQPGNTASDGTGRNGLYTQELLTQMKKPDLAIEEVFKNVRGEVRKKSKNQQVPWESSSIEGKFYFAENVVSPPVVKPPRTEIAVTEQTPAEVEREAWLDVQSATNQQSFRDFLEIFPNGANAGKAKIRLEQLVWESAKDSRDKVKLQSYLNEFPTGVNAPRARLKLTELNTVNTPPAQPAEKAKTFKSSIGMEFVLIPAGTFQMGSKDGGERDLLTMKPVHQVTISKNFYMGKYEVTQGEWKAIMGSLPTKCKDLYGSKEFGIELLGDRKPIVCLTWGDIQEFIKKLNAKGEEKYRLPTEAEWEYAARAGSQTNYSFGDNRKLLKNYGWYNDNSGKKLHEVGLKLPNEFGLYDMHGNVQEMCLDVGAYTSDAKTDPTGVARERLIMSRGTPKNVATNPPVEERVYIRITRGGCWSCGSDVLLSANRNTTWANSDNAGFRLVME